MSENLSHRQADCLQRFIYLKLLGETTPVRIHPSSRAFRLQQLSLVTPVAFIASSSLQLSLQQNIQPSLVTAAAFIASSSLPLAKSAAFSITNHSSTITKLQHCKCNSLSLSSSYSECLHPSHWKSLDTRKVTLLGPLGVLGKEQGQGDVRKTVPEVTLSPRAACRRVRDQGRGGVYHPTSPCTTEKLQCRAASLEISSLCEALYSGVMERLSYAD